MKTKYIIIGFAALALMSSCSKTRTEARQPALPDEDAWVNDETLPIPVTFSTPDVAIESKALITGTATTEDMHFGVYGLATTYVEDTKAHNPAWWDDQPETKLMENVKAVGGAEFKFTKDDWTEELTVYYPMNSDKTFSFYAYYPFSDEVSNAGNCYSVVYDLTTVPDIMWAESHAAALSPDNGLDDRFGFNAKYIRRVKKAENGDGFLPKLTFGHKLAALQFNAVTADGSESSNLAITGLELKDISTSATLVIATNANYSAASTPAGSLRGGTWGIIPLKHFTDASDSEGNVDFSIYPTNGDGNELGTMVVVPGNAGETMKANVSMKVDDQEEVTKEITFKAPAEGFKAGYRYIINVKVLSVEEVSIFTASVEEWKSGNKIDIDEPIG